MPEMTQTARSRTRKQGKKPATRKYAKTSRDGTYRRSPARRGRPPGRTSASKSSQSARRGRKQGSKSGGILGSLGGLFGRPSSKPSKQPPTTSASQAPSISLDRKLDLIGILMLFIGLLTLLSLISVG
ncbi:MAG: hypothetical protein ACM3H7_04335, partial [Acidobacteriaceae bacterium]